MPAAEFDLWVAYATRNGLASDRQVVATALAGVAANRAMGGKAKVSDLIPKFRPRKGSPRAMLAYLKTIPGATVRTYQHG